MKRLLDVVLASVGVVVLAPAFAVIAVAILVTMGGPVLFSQERAGRNGEPFQILKFRSMSAAAAGAEDVQFDDQRITALGSFLRRTSLDELPELVNIIRGNMSLVGPRPLFVEYNDLYDSVQVRRLSTRPGLTGWAQINGRNALSWEEKFELDVWYVENQSFFLDCKILLLTISKVLSSSDISAEGTPTAHRFLGSPTSTGTGQ